MLPRRRQPMRGSAVRANHDMRAEDRSQPRAALHSVGYVLTSHEPDYVVLGETKAYSYEQITQAVRLMGEEGSRVRVWDSDSVTAGLGLLALAACGAAQEVLEIG